MLARFSLGMLMFLVLGSSLAGNCAPDKNRYTLSNPTPREFLRPLSADRPDVTESAYTVDAGRFQLELDVVSFERETGDEDFTIAPFLFKVGLNNNTDFQIGLTPYSVQRTTLGEVTQTIAPDLTIRVKINVWGNDQGDTALALMPFVIIPTSNSGWSGGLIVPFIFNFAEGWQLGSTNAITVVQDLDSTISTFEVLNTLSLGHSFTEELGGFIEVVSLLSTTEDWILTGNAGVTYALTEDWNIDGGVRLGLTPQAPDLRLFTGMTLRF